MDMQEAAQALIDKEARMNARLSPLLKKHVQIAYERGVADTLRLMQELAVADEVKQHEISAPLAVQPSHSANAEEGTEHEIQK